MYIFSSLIRTITIDNSCEVQINEEKDNTDSAVYSTSAVNEAVHRAIVHMSDIERLVYCLYR